MINLLFLLATVFPFPGQGALREGLLRDLPLAEPAVRAVDEEAAQVLSQPLASLDTAAQRRSTEHVQLALLITGVATARALQARGMVPDYGWLGTGAKTAQTTCR